MPFPPSGDLPNPGTEPVSPTSSALASGFFTTDPPGKPTKGISWLKKYFSLEKVKTVAFFSNYKIHPLFTKIRNL